MKQRAYGIFVVTMLAAWLGALPCRAAYPSWWTNRSVITAVATTNDYAAANLGQLKWFATNACAELEQKLVDGAGTGIWTMVAGFAASSNYVAVNVGQLKSVAQPFYDRLIAAGFTNNVYPWTTNTADDANFSAANLGQLKNVFKFDLEQDSDGDGLADWVETGTGEYVGTTNTGSDPYKADTDGDGVNDGAEVSARTDPNNSDKTPPQVQITYPAQASIMVVYP